MKRRLPVPADLGPFFALYDLKKPVFVLYSLLRLLLPLVSTRVRNSCQCSSHITLTLYFASPVDSANVYRRECCEGRN